MATATTVQPDASAKLLPRQAVTLHEVDWETYSKLRDNPANDSIRMAYLDGECSGFGLKVMGIRSTTLRHEGNAPAEGAGKEPDNAFYLGANEQRMRRKKELDLTIDPPPDLAIEVDNARDSEAALPIYARLGVPEVWRFDVRKNGLWFGRLDGLAYVEVDRGVAMPRLTPALVLQALDVYDEGEMDENAWFEWLKAWARDLPEAPANP